MKVRTNIFLIGLVVLTSTVFNVVEFTHNHNILKSGNNCQACLLSGQLSSTDKPETSEIHSYQPAIGWIIESVLEKLFVEIKNPLSVRAPPSL
ncbi:MAG: hypothetical protein ACP5P3_04990 [Ignavibacteria bacterium]